MDPSPVGYFVLIVGLTLALFAGPLLRWLQEPLPAEKRGKFTMKPIFFRLIGVFWVVIGYFFIRDAEPSTGPTELAPLIMGAGVTVAGVLFVIFRRPIFRSMSGVAKATQGKLGRKLWEMQTPRVVTMVGILWVLFGIAILASAL